LRARRDQFAMEGEAKAAGLLHGEDLVAFGHPLADLNHEFRAGKFAWGFERRVPGLADDHAEIQVNVEAELEPRLGRIQHGDRQRLAWRYGSLHDGLVARSGEG
jgi:hypothetical protein